MELTAYEIRIQTMAWAAPSDTHQTMYLCWKKVFLLHGEGWTPYDTDHLLAYCSKITIGSWQTAHIILKDMMREAKIKKRMNIERFVHKIHHFETQGKICNIVTHSEI